MLHLASFIWAMASWPTEGSAENLRRQVGG
jgi:hypothetical protein